ncbi:uncharacterized protein LOC106641092 [Copidosoma floridanum]|uniref:uncharacterized protein LOC106641092 n=1 Tax=Copidosoma floridanum TaxID=29053 RepID=UPI0006C995D3|nr:uncharacterized protein LOC106641092 [Copidosoma floridanum]
MFKRNLNHKDNSSSKKRFKQNENSPTSTTRVENDPWGDDFEEKDIEEMDFIASQATQEEVFILPPPVAGPSSSVRRSFNSSSVSFFSERRNENVAAPSQMLASSDSKKEIVVSTQALRFDEFERNVKSNSHNSTFRTRPESTSGNVVLVSDDEQVENWKEEKKKMLEDFLTKEGETEFLRQQLNQIQARAEKAKIEQARASEEQMEVLRLKINALTKEKTSLESQLEIQNFQFNKVSEKCKMLETGSVKFAQPQVNIIKAANKDRANTSIGWSPKKVKTKENGVQADQSSSIELLRSSLILYPLKTIPQYAFEPCETEKSVVDIKIEEKVGSKIEEKIGKKKVAIFQDEETFRIFENPELFNPKTTVVYGKTLSTEFFMPDLAQLINKTREEINCSHVIPTINKLVATMRELLLNSTIVLRNISLVLKNDDLRDMNELYLSEFYEMPVLHTKSFHEAHPWYDLERGIETRRAVGVLAHVALVSDYLADYVAGNVKLRTDQDPFYKLYAKQMVSYDAWDRKGFDFEFLDLVLEFVTIIGKIRRSHQFAGLINALMTLIVNVQATVGFPQFALNKVCSIFKAIVYSRPLLTCFPTISKTLREFSEHSEFVEKLCISPGKSGISNWKGSLNFTTDACPIEIFIAQLEHFKLDPITLVNITRDLASFSLISLLNDSIPWLEKTMNSCNCCLNLLKFVVINLCECSKINVVELKNKYTETNISSQKPKLETDKKNNKTSSKEKLYEDWKRYEQNSNVNFWDALKTLQYSAIAFGIRLLSFLAKRDLDFMIRLTYIEDAFHMFLDNLNIRSDLELKKSDEVALDIVKKTFVLEKNKEESRIQGLNMIGLESERWIDFTPSNADLIKLYEE